MDRLVTSQRRTICTGRPPVFHGRAGAVQWAVLQGAWGIDEAMTRYDALCKVYAGSVWPFWIREVGRKLHGR